MNYPKISIVTPSFNQGSFLEETIESVLGQGYPNLEYVIIDGGSTDNSVEVIKKYEKHLTFWVSEKDKGMYDAIQKGFSKTTGEVMGWINSDDRYHPKSFFVLAEIFSSFPEVEWLQGNPTSIDETGRIISIQTSRKWSKYNFFLGDYKYIQQESTFWRRSLWEKAGSMIRTDMRYAGDFELWLRFFEHARLYCLQTAIGAFRMRSSNQFSLDMIDKYNEEVEAEISKKLQRLTKQEQKDLATIQKYKGTYSKLPVLKYRKYTAYLNIFDYPPPIIFDRKKQAFYLYKKEK
jgi:glycosyltransferase involved in cell wall biosynthesis